MTETNRWIPVKVRPLTDEEKKLYEESVMILDVILSSMKMQMILWLGCRCQSLIRRVSKNENSL